VPFVQNLHFDPLIWTAPWRTNPQADYGNSDLNVPNRFVASATYQLPFQGSGWVGHLERGWQVNGILQFFDGLPFSATSSGGVGDGLTPRARLLPGFGNGSLPPGQRTIAKWFNTAAFISAPTGQWGNTGRNILQGPGTKNVDFSLFKNIYLAEGVSLQLRSEFFNLANTPQFNNPAATSGAPSFGTISSAGSPNTLQRISREIQLAAKISF
jgi:hypothetical protein